MTNKPATESTVAQGASETSNPSGSDLKPPLGLEPALIPVSLAGLHPGPWPPVSLNPD